MAWGGDRLAHAFEQQQAWPRMVRFLHQTMAVAASPINKSLLQQHITATADENETKYKSAI